MRILLVEDEIKLGKALKSGLELEGYAVDLLHTYEDGLAYGETEEYDIYLLDRMLPDGKDGLDILKYLRSIGKDIPALFMSAKGEVEDKIIGLDSGGDDYIVKPFSFDELTARVRALVRRPNKVANSVIKLDDLEIDTVNKQVKLKGKSIKLSRKEYAILEYLALHFGQVINKEQIIKHVWDFDADILPNTVEVFIRGIRKKLDNNGPSVIETIRGFGYRIGKNE